jgi:hypothetical protein
VSLHAHDWVLLAGLLFGVALLIDFLRKRTGNSRSPLNLEDMFLDATTRRLSWILVMCTFVIGSLVLVLLQQALAGRPVETLAGILASAVVIPLVTRIATGGEKVTPAQYASTDPKPAPAPAPGPAVQLGGNSVNITP